MAQSGLFIGTQGEISVTHRKTQTPIGMFFRTKTEINLAFILFRLVEILLWQSMYMIKAITKKIQGVENTWYTIYSYFSVTWMILKMSSRKGKEIKLVLPPCTN